MGWNSLRGPCGSPSGTIRLITHGACVVTQTLWQPVGGLGPLGWARFGKVVVRVGPPHLASKDEDEARPAAAQPGRCAPAIVWREEPQLLVARLTRTPIQGARLFALRLTGDNMTMTDTGKFRAETLNLRALSFPAR